MSAAPQKPKHPKAGLYLQYKLFHGILRFAELEQRIANLPTKQERGDAFEVFTEAYLATQRLYQVKTVWSFSRLPLAIKERFALGQSDVGVDGVLKRTWVSSTPIKPSSERVVPRSPGMNFLPSWA